MKNKVSGSYVNNGICDVCGFKKKSYELFKRWDNFMVCKEDWETRNIADFYDTANDTHLLPWTRPDTGTTTEFTPSFAAVTQTLNSGTITNSGMLIVDPIARTCNFQITMIVTKDATIGFTSVASKVNLPTAYSPCAVTGDWNIMRTDGTLQLVEIGGISAGLSATNALPVAKRFSNLNSSLIIRGSYGY